LLGEWLEEAAEAFHPAQAREVVLRQEKANRAVLAGLAAKNEDES
jgi:hypothetical protein